MGKGNSHNRAENQLFWKLFLKNLFSELVKKQWLAESHDELVGTKIKCFSHFVPRRN
jgi:hypothetical protein